ncbi:hypothetical protein CDL12_28504 [Handroanthus impetiginosus]|uniref:Uncharacterized protein n=1 Tax=Handroanthus impetiginosus TaxID=429701 RepID=A0A2G9G100_9LAMI|nr:hypothetical protein CDL12_28504 [Handroanthus impetiginosus]
MMDINDDEDVVFGLALGSKNYPVRSRLNDSSGAGVNANSRVDMAFAASDPLSELVWSPNSGLILKCADSNLGDNKPVIPGNVELSTKDLSTSPSNRSKGSGDNKVVDEEKLTMSQTMLDGDRKIGVEDTLFRSCRSSSSRELEASREYCNADKMEEEGGTKDNRDKDLSGSQNVQIADVAESSKRNAEQHISAERIDESKVEMAINRELSRKSSEALLNLQSRPEPDDEVTSASREMNKNKMALMTQESSAENDFERLAAKEVDYLDKTRFLRETSLPVDKCLADSRACL